MSSHNRQMLSRTRSTRARKGQTALVMVVALSVGLALVGIMLVSIISANGPAISNASVQRYAFRALESGENSYLSSINANPYLAACNNTVNNTTACAGLSYQTWSVVPGTNVGGGVIPEYYRFDNPQQIIDPTTKGILYLEVQIIGAAGYGNGGDVYYSSIVKFTPQNGFLNNIWWSNYQQFPGGGGSAASCQYYWQSHYNTSNLGACGAVYFGPNDVINGPVYSNDSIFVSGTPSFTSSGVVSTADPNCLFVNGSENGSYVGCSNNNSNVTYNTANSFFGAPIAPIPTVNTQLATFAKQGGCYYQGPTTVTASVVGGVGKLSITSPDTANTSGVDTLNLGIDTSTCRTDGTLTNYPANGVIYIDQSASGASSVNPFYSSTTGLSQVAGNCSGCYYGQTANPGTEGDAFVNGPISGHLTIDASNDVVIDGPITYSDCTTWTGTTQQSVCNYNSALTGTNDTLGLIAGNYVTVNRPIYNPSASHANAGNPLPSCNGTTWVAPLCDPSTATGAPGSTQGLTIDASILALGQSFVTNNYSAGSTDGTLNIYGSIQQNARGPVGIIGSAGYTKYYTWDPRLALYAPPSYLTPGTPSWALISSAATPTGTNAPSEPPAQVTPVTAVPSWPIANSTVCPAPS